MDEEKVVKKLKENIISLRERLMSEWSNGNNINQLKKELEAEMGILNLINFSKKFVKNG